MTRLNWGLSEEMVNKKSSGFEPHFQHDLIAILGSGIPHFWRNYEELTYVCIHTYIHTYVYTHIITNDDECSLVKGPIMNYDICLPISLWWALSTG